MSQKISKVAIVGAGPVGLLGALELAKLGISVDVIDLLERIDPRPRAAGYGPSAVREVLFPSQVLRNSVLRKAAANIKQDLAPRRSPWKDSGRRLGALRLLLEKDWR